MTLEDRLHKYCQDELGEPFYTGVCMNGNILVGVPSRSKYTRKPLDLQHEGWEQDWKDLAEDLTQVLLEEYGDYELISITPSYIELEKLS